MSTPQDDTDATPGIEDEQLPEDLRPSEENPLAQALGEDEVDAADLDMDGGKLAEEMDDPAEEQAEEQADDRAGDA